MLTTILEEETDDNLLATTVWAFGQMGKHSAEHSRALAAANILVKMLQVNICLLIHREFKPKG